MTNAQCIVAFSLCMSSALGVHTGCTFTGRGFGRLDGCPGEQYEEHICTAWGAGPCCASCRKALGSPNQELRELLCGSVIIDFNFSLPLYHFLLLVQHNSSGVCCRQRMSLARTLVPAWRIHFVCLMFKEKKLLSSVETHIFFLVCFELFQCGST